MSPEVRVSSRLCEDRGLTAVRLRGWADDPGLTVEWSISAMTGSKTRVEAPAGRQEWVTGQVGRRRDKMLTQVAVDGVDFGSKPWKREAALVYHEGCGAGGGGYDRSVYFGMSSWLNNKSTASPALIGGTDSFIKVSCFIFRSETLNRSDWCLWRIRNKHSFNIKDWMQWQNNTCSVVE